MIGVHGVVGECMLIGDMDKSNMGWLVVVCLGVIGLVAVY